MKRAVLKRLTAFIATLLVVALVSPSFVYSVSATASESGTGVAVEEPQAKETEAVKVTKADEKKPAKDTKAKETQAKETTAKEPEAKETEAKAKAAKESL